MEMIQYFAVSVLTSAGLLAGTIVSHFAKDERALLKIHLKKFVFPTRQEIVFAIFAILFAVLSQTDYLILISAIIFLYGIIAGSFLFVQNKIKALVIAGVIFIICSMLARLATIFLF